MKPGDVVADCGAHVGVFARYALARGASCVICIEVDASNFPCLPARFLPRTPGNRHPGSSMEGVWNCIPSFLHSSDDSDRHQLSETAASDRGVQADTLDRLLERLNLQRLDFLKVDVEGSEPEVLEGAMRSLRTFCPRLAVAAYHHPEEEAQIRALFRQHSLAYDFSYKALVADQPHILFAAPSGR